VALEQDEVRLPELAETLGVVHIAQLVRLMDTYLVAPSMPGTARELEKDMSMAAVRGNQGTSRAVAQLDIPVAEMVAAASNLLLYRGGRNQT